MVESMLMQCLAIHVMMETFLLRLIHFIAFVDLLNSDTCIILIIDVTVANYALHANVHVVLQNHTQVHVYLPRSSRYK